MSAKGAITVPHFEFIQSPLWAIGQQASKLLQTLRKTGDLPSLSKIGLLLKTTLLSCPGANEERQVINRNCQSLGCIDDKLYLK